MNITITQTIGDSGDTISASTTHAVQTIAKLKEAIPDSSTDLEFLIAIDVSALKVFYMCADQDITIETNDGTAPDETFSLLANKPITWQEGETAIFGQDITALYATNSSGSSATLQIMLGVDMG